MATHAMTSTEKDAVRTEFSHLVNMSPARLRRWLDTDESRSVGMTSDGEKVTGVGPKKSVGHHMGERILAITRRKQDALSDEDFADMRKVIGYIHRHTAQRPKGDVRETRWRKSLMNWGHDPA
jgi:hypothetical protein